MKRSHLLLALFVSLLAWHAPAPAAAATPAGADVLRLHTGLPQRRHDSLFSYNVEWRKDQGELYRATGISFFNAAKMDADAPPAAVAKKLAIAMRDGLIPMDPGWRGLTLDQPAEQPLLTLSNKAGFSFTNIIVRDYTNQALGFDLNGAAFNAKRVEAALDLVLAADVEYLDGFASKKGLTTSQGEIIVTLDQQPPLHIQTEGKSTQQLEQELAQRITGATFSNESLVPMLINLDKRNNKPFDGGEVQLLNSGVKSLRMEITDPAVGVLTKFKYPDENHTVEIIEPRFMMALLAVTVFGVIGFLYWRNRKNPL